MSSFLSVWSPLDEQRATMDTRECPSAAPPFVPPRQAHPTMEHLMQTLTSADGTPIAYERPGRRPRDRLRDRRVQRPHHVRRPRRRLAGDHTVVTYDRRARGRERRHRAVRDRAGGRGSGRADRHWSAARAAVFGYSSGAHPGPRGGGRRRPGHAPRAVRGAVRRSAACPHDRDLPARLDGLIAAGRPGDAVALFQTEGVGSRRDGGAVPQLAEWPALVGDRAEHRLRRDDHLGARASRRPRWPRSTSRPW